MEKLKCVVTDDEPIARKILENYIQDIPHLELVASCKDAFEVMELLQRDQSIDLLFLDINMPRLSGLSLIKTLQQRPQIIITTAYPEYAIEGFELSVTDYLLKPISLERFLKAITKVKNIKKENTLVEFPQNSTQPKDIFIKSDKKIIKINSDHILYIEAYGNYIKIYTDKMIISAQTLTHFLEDKPTHFVRVHKSFAINFNHLEFIEGNQIYLSNGAKIPIGKSYKHIILERLT